MVWSRFERSWVRRDMRNPTCRGVNGKIVTYNYGVGLLFSATQVFGISNWRLAAIDISNEIY
jgi:hypothetical protein